jgi:hypothetical protein
MRTVNRAQSGHDVECLTNTTAASLCIAEHELECAVCAHRTRSHAHT